MPLYEYQCDSCGHRFEVIQKFSDPPVAVCPKCGGAVHKLVSSPAFQFKGTGWYVTDYGKKTTESSKSSSKTESSTTSKETTSETSDKSEKKESSSKETGTKDSTPPAKS